MDRDLRRLITPRNPVVFLDIRIDSKTVGRIEIEWILCIRGGGSLFVTRQQPNPVALTTQLRADVVPNTAENFRVLCTGERGIGRYGKPMQYAHTRFHRAMPDMFVQGGDIVHGDGSGGESIYASPQTPTFRDENFKLCHDQAGVVSMANFGPNTNTSQFFISVRPLPWLDGKNVVFGRVISGFEIVDKIEQQGLEDGTLRAEVIIENAGQLV